MVGWLPRLVVSIQWRFRVLRALGWDYFPPSRLRTNVIRAFAQRTAAEITEDGPKKLLHLLDPGVTMRQTVEAIGTDQAYVGRDGFEKMLDAIYGQFVEVDWAVSKVREVVPRESLVASVDLSARGRGSRVPVSFKLVFLITIRRGLMTRFDAYGNEREALEAAGLSE